MKVEVEHGKLLIAVARLGGLADEVERGRARASAGTPVDLPSLDVLPAKVAWMCAQVPDLEDLAALALLLDTGGTGSAAFEMPGDTWDVEAMLDGAVAARFGPDFATDSGLDDDQLRALLIAFGSVGKTLPPEVDVMTPGELRTLVVEHPDLARALTGLSPRPGAGPEGTIFSLLQPVLTAPGGGAEIHEERRIAARDLFESLPSDQASILAMMFPSTVGTLSGVPFSNLAAANTVRIVVALDDERTNLSDLEARHEHHQHDWDFLGRNNDDLEGPIEDSGRRIDLYESILRDDRQILFFDPSGDGAMVEIDRPVTASTQNVGVLVPGTTSDLPSFDGNARRSRTFSDADPDGALSMITWMGGDLPDSIGRDAPFANYAIDLGPGLADFSHDVRLEIERAGSPARTTYAGHSYGGAVVGRSELHALDADRVLHIESAGMGHDVHDAGDLPSSQSGVDRYSMTAPGDLIELAQGAPQVTDNIGHGADPDDFPGTVRLHTGDKVGGTPNTGVGSHTSVFQEGSDAWQNMYAVFTGGKVETYRSPNYEHVFTGRGVATYQDGWNDDGEKVDIP